MQLRFDSDADFDTDEHQTLRETAWMGGPYAELKYLLSCLTRINYWDLPFETWNADLRKFIAQHNPAADWILCSRAFHGFAVLLIRELYRQSAIGQRFPIAAEKRKHAAARFAITHPQLDGDSLAKKLDTTIGQLQRNADVQLVISEYRRLTPDS